MIDQSTFPPKSNLKTNEAIGFSYRAPMRGYRSMGTPKDKDLCKVYLIMGEDLM